MKKIWELSKKFYRRNKNWTIVTVCLNLSYCGGILVQSGKWKASAIGLIMHLISLALIFCKANEADRIIKINEVERELDASDQYETIRIPRSFIKK